MLVASLLADVFQGRLRAGQHLVAQELADRFGVSPTPVREALIELAGIGIVDLLPNRGAIVRHVTGKDVREVCKVRRVLECEATRSACGRIDPAQLHGVAETLRGLLATGAAPIADFIGEARAVDSRLHDLIANSCGNAFLANELGRLKMLFRAFRDVSYTRHEAHQDYRRLAEEAREHLAIVEALITGDARMAVRAMARHILTGGRYWGRALPSPGSAQALPVSRNGKRKAH